MKPLPVIIFSTSFDMELVELLYQNEAHQYIRKPDEYSQLRKVILDALTLTAQNNFIQTTRVQYVLQT